MTFITEKVPVVEERATGIKCDYCDRVYEVNTPLFYFDSHHQGWGNDSVDSYEYYHACSIECFKGILKNCIEKLKSDSRTAEIAGMPYDFAVKMLEAIK